MSADIRALCQRTTTDLGWNQYKNWGGNCSGCVHDKAWRGADKGTPNQRQSSRDRKKFLCLAASKAEEEGKFEHNE